MRRYSRPAIVMIVAGMLLLMVGEMLVRAFPTVLPIERQIRTQAVMMKDRVLADKDTGFVRQPNSRQEVRTLDFSFVREADALGFPNRGPWPSHADIVFLGDSFVTGEGVGLDKSFVGLFSKVIDDVTIRNLGVAGAGPDRQQRIYYKYGNSLRPEFVLAVLYVASDFQNVEHFQTWLKEAPDRDYNRFRLNLGKDYGRLSLLDPSALLERSRFLEAVRGQFTKLAQGSKGEVVDTGDGSPLFIAPRTLEFLRTEMRPDDPKLHALLTPFEDLNRRIRATGAQFFVMLMPSKEEVYLDADAVVTAVMKRLAASSVPFLDLYSPLRSEVHGPPLYYTRDPHLNERGNAVVARFLVEWWRGRNAKLMHTRFDERQDAVSASGGTVASPSVTAFSSNLPDQDAHQR
jgi:hypothetical protein